MKTWTTIADKSDWGAGDWVGEPDKAYWVDAGTGLPCLALRSPNFGAWCGYVGVPVGHPLHGMDRFGDAVQDAELPCGVNYSAPCDDATECGCGNSECDERPMEQRVCHTPAAGEPDGVWWFGFDLGHVWDYCPKLMADLPETVRDLRGRIAEHQSYKPLSYVRGECERLATRLLEVAGGPSTVCCGAQAETET